MNWDRRSHPDMIMKDSSGAICHRYERGWGAGGGGWGGEGGLAEREQGDGRPSVQAALSLAHNRPAQSTENQHAACSLCLHHKEMHCRVKTRLVWVIQSFLMFALELNSQSSGG